MRSILFQSLLRQMVQFISNENNNLQCLGILQAFIFLTFQVLFIKFGTMWDAKLLSPVKKCHPPSWFGGTTLGLCSAVTRFESRSCCLLSWVALYIFLENITKQTHGLGIYLGIGHDNSLQKLMHSPLMITFLSHNCSRVFTTLIVSPAPAIPCNLWNQKFITHPN
jgi:hypothetical protein